MIYMVRDKYIYRFVLHLKNLTFKPNMKAEDG